MPLFPFPSHSPDDCQEKEDAVELVTGSDSSRTSRDIRLLLTSNRVICFGIRVNIFEMLKPNTAGLAPPLSNRDDSHTAHNHNRVVEQGGILVNCTVRVGRGAEHSKSKPVPQESNNSGDHAKSAQIPKAWTEGFTRDERTSDSNQTVCCEGTRS